MTNPLETLTLDQLRERTSIKWRRYPEDVLPLWVAEMDVPQADPVRRAVTDAVERGDTGYPDGTAYAGAVAAFATHRWGWRIDVEHTAVVADVMNGIVAALRLVTGPEAAAVVNSPVYTPFYAFTRYTGRRVVESPLGADGRIDFRVLEDTFAEVTKGGRPAAYLLCSPHNPTGTVHTRDELLAVVRLAKEYGVRVVVDEIHAPIVYPDATHTPFLTLPGAEDAFVVFSASKAWNLAGIKSALLVAGPEAANDLARMPEEVSHGSSHLGVIAHVAALEHGGDWLAEVLAGLDRNRGLLGDLLAKHLPDVGS